jgi:TolA-binding protein
MLLAAFVVVGAAACKKSPQEAAAAKLAADKADKKQKAIRHYQELVKKYPNSEYAEKAKTRLQTLGPAATPAKK